MTLTGNRGNFNFENKRTAKNTIPFPSYYSWMHSRITITEESLEEKMKRWKNQPCLARAVDAVLSRFMRFIGLHKANRRWILYKLVSKVFKWTFKIFNQLDVKGVEKIPKSGCIFYCNHPGTLDPLILAAALPFPASMFVAWSHGWFMDFTEKMLGFLVYRSRDSRDVKIEKYVRQIMLKNRYFAIWPSGHPTRTNKVEQGFSSIIRAYAVLNSKKDIIPFLPVLVKGAEIYTYPPYPRPGKISIEFHDPFYLPRKWLLPLDQGGKTPRESIDYIMHKLAVFNGQKTFVSNVRLEENRKRYKLKEKLKKES